MPKLTTEISGDFDQMAIQIYDLHVEAGNEIIVSYKHCKFVINFTTGDIAQQLQTQGAVHSQLSSKLAAIYVGEIKIAHSLAADISLLEDIKSIKDDVLKKRITDLLHSEPNARASIILKLLEKNPQLSSLQVMGLFQSSAMKSSPALEAVRTVLRNLDLTQIDTIGKADQVWDQIQTTLTKKVTPQRP